jgi:hypothetical protein
LGIDVILTIFATVNHSNNRIITIMKKLLFTMFVGMMALGVMAQGGKFIVQGGFLCEGDSLKLQIIDCDYQLLYEVTRAASAEMFFSFDLKDAALLVVVDGQEGYQRHHIVPAIPGDTVLFYMEGEPYYGLGGSQFYIDYDEAVQAIEPQAIELFEQDAHSDRYLEVLNNYEEALLAYVKNHPDQEASAALLAIFGEDADIERGDTMLTERVRNSVVANLFKAKLAAVKERKLMMPQF